MSWRPPERPAYSQAQVYGQQQSYGQGQSYQQQQHRPVQPYQQQQQHRPVQPYQQQQYRQGQPYQQQEYGYQGPARATAGVNPELWAWFQALDQDHDGQISTEELQTALMNGNWSPFNEETCRLMVGMFDRDKSGTIDFNEFGTLWKYIQDWKGCFDGFDRDRSGTIDVNELNEAFCAFGYRLSPEFCRLVIQKFDRHDRRSINFDDFIQACVMLHILTNAFRVKDVNGTGNIRVSYEQFLEMALDSTVRN